LLPLVERAKSRQFLDSMVSRHARAMSGVVGAYTKDVERHIPIHPEYVAVALDEEASDDAVFTVDTGCVTSGRRGTSRRTAGGG